ncbi:MAG: hypothetical protein JNN04_09690 [Cyclobacteriaceae bacterium]|nr:hypothetical protein [Cyclobacteriaceae bacterium]
MKTINKSLLTTAGILLGLLSCSEPELPTPNTFSSGATYKATFSFANATVDAPSLDFYVNGVKLGSATPGGGSSLVTTVQIPTPGISGGVTANTAIRARATSGTIGGKLGSADLIFRATNNGTGIFAAVNNANYTVIAVDSINRPVPVRLNRQTATIAFADVTYWNPNTQSMITASRRDSLNPVNCPACLNWDGAAQNPSTATEYANLVTVGLVPLGLTDPGGVRFYVTTDAPLTFNAGNVATNAGIRFINAVANANGISAAPNANGTFGGPAIHARLRPSAGPNITLASGTSSVVSVAGGFSPTVGSRTAGNLAFTSQTIATAGTPTVYTLEVATDAGYTNILYSTSVSFLPGKNYTVFVRGMAGATGTKAITHGVITH